MKQYDIFLVNLDPTLGSEIRKTLPCIIISPDEMNDHIRTVQIAPMTSTTRVYPWRAPITFQDKKGMVALDQIRTIDKQRLLRKLGKASVPVQNRIKGIIDKMLVQ